MKYFLSFMGYPRSGHTLVAAILNANPNCMISNQLNVYHMLQDIDYIKSYSLDSNTWKDTTQIPHVPKKEITVVGDKTGHRTTVMLGDIPQRLGIVKEHYAIPFKWIHVVRNPYDNLATWARLNHINKKKKDPTSTIRKHLDDVIQKYRLLNATIERLRRSEDVLTVNHEYIITRMHNTLEEICNFLEISFDPEWRDNVRNTVWNKPRVTRNQVKWSTPQRLAVEKLIDQYEWLNGYDFGGCTGCGKN